MITKSQLTLANEAMDTHLSAIERHNEGLAALHIAIHDPVARETKRQRQIIDAALLSLASGDTTRTRDLLSQL